MHENVGDIKKGTAAIAAVPFFSGGRPRLGCCTLACGFRAVKQVRGDLAAMIFSQEI